MTFSSVSASPVNILYHVLMAVYQNAGTHKRNEASDLPHTVPRPHKASHSDRKGRIILYPLGTAGGLSGDKMALLELEFGQDTGAKYPDSYEKCPGIVNALQSSGLSFVVFSMKRKAD